MNARDELDNIHAQLLADVRQQEDYLYSRVSAIGAYSEGAEHALDTIRNLGYRKPRAIHATVSADALSTGAIILTPQGYTMEKLSDGWYRAGVDHTYAPNSKWFPATVLHEPEVTA